MTDAIVPAEAAPSLVRVVMNEADVTRLEEIGALCDKLTQPLPPDKRLDVLEKLAVAYGTEGRASYAKMKMVVRYIKETGLWHEHWVLDNTTGRRQQEFQTENEYEFWILSQIRDLSIRTFYNDNALLDQLQQLGMDDEMMTRLLEHPSRARTALEVVEFDHAGHFAGVTAGADGNALQRMAETVGITDVQGTTVAEIARTFVAQAATADDTDTRAVVDKVTGGWRVRWYYADDKGGGGPRIVVNGWNPAAGARGRYQHEFYLSDDARLHPEAERWLDRNRQRQPSASGEWRQRGRPRKT